MGWDPRSWVKDAGKVVSTATKVISAVANPVGYVTDTALSAGKKYLSGESLSPTQKKNAEYRALREAGMPSPVKTSAEVDFGVDFQVGKDIDIVTEEQYDRIPTDVPGEFVYRKKRSRRRRRRLLTASDKADIAFLIGQLGTGQLGRAAISSILSRRS